MHISFPENRRVPRLGFSGMLGRMSSRDNLTNLLDSMLEDSAVQQAAEEVRAREAKEREERERQAAALRKAAQAPSGPAFTDVETLTGLTDGDLSKILAKAPPDDLLVLLATAGDVLQRRILMNLSSDSVKWLRDNLAHIEEVSRAEKEAAHKKVLKVANQLFGSGEIKLPEPEAVGSEEAPTAIDRDLRELLSELVRIASTAGPEALTEVVQNTEEPLLTEGLALVVQGANSGTLRKLLRDKRAALEAEYGKRLLWIEDAIVAIADKEAPDAFRAKLFPKK
jgi:hypothetical protein